MKRTFNDKLQTNLKYKKDDNGFLHLNNSKIARIGVQSYGYGNVYRPPEEVFNIDSLKSFEGVPLTLYHPKSDDNGYFVDTENYKDLTKGSIRNVRQDGDYVLADITVYDSNLINLIESGNISELSAGYSSYLIKKDGEFNGEQYQYIQSEIRANHLAFVDVGNCTSSTHKCSINLDGGKMEKVKIGEVELSFDDKLQANQVQNAFNLAVKNYDEKLLELEAKEKEIELLKGKTATLDSINAELKSKIDTIEMQKVKDEISKIATINLDGLNSSIDIKRAFLSQHLKLDDKVLTSDDAVNGAYEVAKSSAIKSALAGAIKTTDSKEMSYEDIERKAHEQMINRSKGVK